MTTATKTETATEQLVRLGMFDPTDVSAKHLAGAPALASLAGKVPGLLDNRKGNGDRILDRIGQILVEQYGTEQPVRSTKFLYARRASPEIIEQLVAQTDFVITAVGD